MPNLNFQYFDKRNHFICGRICFENLQMQIFGIDLGNAAACVVASRRLDPEDHVFISGGWNQALKIHQLGFKKTAVKGIFPTLKYNGLGLLGLGSLRVKTGARLIGRSSGGFIVGGRQFRG